MQNMIPSATQTMLKAVQEEQAYRREKMGREYASGHEIWAKAKQLLEEAKADIKTIESLQGELWGAVKSENDEEVNVDLHVIGNKAEEICMIFAALAAESHRAAEELRGRW